MLQLAVFFPVIAMFFIPFLRKNFKNIHTGKFVIIVPLILFGYFVSNIKYIYSGGTIYKIYVVFHLKYSYSNMNIRLPRYQFL